MNTHLYVICFLIALIGMAFSTVSKMVGLKQKAKVANASFKVADYFADDWLSILASFLFIILSMFLIDALLGWKPAVTNYVKPIFAFVGYFGGDLGARIFSATNKRINQVIDEKTDIADGVNKPKT